MIIKSEAENLVITPAIKTNNYWPPLSCLVKEQEEDKEVEHKGVDHLWSAVTDMQTPKLQNKVAAKWKQKLKNQSSILDTGYTLAGGAKHDVDCFHYTGLLSKKVSCFQTR
jgi:hypothetical protein